MQIKVTITARSYEESEIADLRAWAKNCKDIAQEWGAFMEVTVEEIY